MHGVLSELLLSDWCMVAYDVNNALIEQLMMVLLGVKVVMLGEVVGCFTILLVCRSAMIILLHTQHDKKAHERLIRRLRLWQQGIPGVIHTTKRHLAILIILGMGGLRQYCLQIDEVHKACYGTCP